MPKHTNLIGKKVTCNGLTVEIAEVESASNYGKNGGFPYSALVDDWFIEFKDTKGIVRYWKQEIDGGYLHD